MPYPPLKMTASTVELAAIPKGFFAVFFPPAALPVVPVPEPAHDASTPPAGMTSAVMRAPRRKSRRWRGVSLMDMSSAAFHFSWLLDLLGSYCSVGNESRGQAVRLSLPS